MSEEIPQVLTIQGQEVDSRPEYIVGQALEKLKIEFIYQYEIFGGKSVRGGQVIDFLLLIPPLPIPLFVNGEYWHTGENAEDDELKLLELKNATQGIFADPVILWDYEFSTIDEAIGLIRQRCL